MKKRGQMDISFGMIFTIILIVAFMAFAFYAIKIFLGFQKDVQNKQFFENFQREVDKMYKSTYGSEPVSFNFPTNVEEVCFRNIAEKNVVLELKKGYDDKTINHLNMEAILNEREEICATVTENKITFIFSKEYGENLVTVKF